MPSTLEAAIREAYATSPSNEVVLETLEFSHADVAEPIRLVKNRESLTLTLETAEAVLFTGAGFRMVLPAAGENGLQDLTISVDAVDPDSVLRDFINTVKDSADPVIVTYRPYLSSDLTTPQMNPPLTLWLRDINLNAFEASGRASFADIINKKFPTALYTRRRFPSLGN